ncbi:MAG: hypothetical protein HS132_05360 [Planctomycetia bacterium]|nr:hypothetical protein [Planctomycetia bacterium]
MVGLNKPTETVDRRKKNIKLGDILRLSKRGMSYREIGLILGCTKQATGFRLRKWERSKMKGIKCQSCRH